MLILGVFSALLKLIRNAFYLTT